MTGSTEETNDVSLIEMRHSDFKKAKEDIELAIKILANQAYNPTPNVLAIRQALGILRGIKL